MPAPKRSVKLSQKQPRREAAYLHRFFACYEQFFMKFRWKPDFLILVSLFGFFLVFWFPQSWGSGWCNDEAAHIPSGLYHLKTGGMEPYRVNPPLPRMIAAIPLLFYELEFQGYSLNSPYGRVEYSFAHSFLLENRESAQVIFFLCRCTVLLFVIIGLGSVYCWAQQLHGRLAASIAGSMWIMNPDVLTHSAVAASDLPASAAGLLVGFLFWAWLRKDNRKFPLGIAAAVAFAVLCKFSWLILFVALPILVLAHDAALHRLTIITGEVQKNGELNRLRILLTTCRDVGRLTLSFVVSIVLINCCYGFEQTGKSLGEFEFVCQTLSGTKVELGIPGNRFSESSLARIPVPFPAEMVRGIDFQKRDFERKLPCYLRGRWQRGGWWYFHLYAMAIKIPVGYWILIAVGLITWCWDIQKHLTDAKREWVSLVLGALILVLVSTQTGFTHHVRYVLPAYGFLFVFASRIGIVFPAPVGFAIATSCLLGTLWFHSTHLGLAHTYFNSASGGPENGWRHLSHSNVDWGQSTYRIADWIERNPQHRPITAVFRSSLGDPHELLDKSNEIASRASWNHSTLNGPPEPIQQGWYVISAFQMTLPRNRYFWSQEVFSQPDPDILVFKVFRDEETRKP